MKIVDFGLVFEINDLFLCCLCMFSYVVFEVLDGEMVLLLSDFVSIGYVLVELFVGCFLF